MAPEAGDVDDGLEQLAEQQQLDQWLDEVYDEEHGDAPGGTQLACRERAGVSEGSGGHDASFSAKSGAKPCWARANVCPVCVR